MVLYYNISPISTNQQSTATTVDTSETYFNNSRSYAIPQLYTSKQSSPYTRTQAVDTSVQPSAKFDVSVNEKNNTSDQKISILSNVPEKSTITDTALSVDDKLNLIQNYLNSGLEKITIYILICIALLVIIAIKLYR